VLVKIIRLLGPQLRVSAAGPLLTSRIFSTRGGSGSAASTAASAAFFEALFGLPERLGGSLVSALGRVLP